MLRARAQYGALMMAFHKLRVGPQGASPPHAPASHPPSIAGVSPLTPIQWLVCVVAGLGFAFDLYESLMGALIVGPVLSTLGSLTPGTPAFNSWVSLFFVVPAVAGGIFGLLGGYLADRFGRRRVLFWSILLYAFSSCAASVATSLPQLLLWRCTTLIGVSMEAVAALAWVAELFPVPRQRERALSYTQACYALGGMLVAGAYFLAVTYASRMPLIRGGHEAWRYTLLSGLLPALPLIIVRPFLPESRVWRQRKAGKTLQRPTLAALFTPHLRATTSLTIVMMACLLALPYGALQQTPRIVPGLTALQQLSPAAVQQRVSAIFLLQEFGSVTGRLVFGLAVVRITQQARLLRLFLIPALVVFPWLFFAGSTHGLVGFGIGVFCAQALFNAMHSFSGNYLPRVYPTFVRVTGESAAMNIGGRVIGAGGALLTTRLANVVPASTASTRLAYAAGTTALLVLLALLVASYWLPEPRSDLLPE